MTCVCCPAKDVGMEAEVVFRHVKSALHQDIF